MTQFKKGDIVRRVSVNERLNPYNGMPVGTEAEVLVVNDFSGGLTLTGWGAGHESSRFELVTKPEIKAGDTVTVERADWTAFGNERKGYTLTGEVYEVDGGLWVGPISLGVHDVTVVAHAPAPEPEPEWLPGMLVRATADGLENSELWRVMDPQKYGAEQRWIDRHGDPVPDSKVTDVRPLVVIDLSTVDAEVLVQRAIESAQDKGYWPDRDVATHMIRHTLADLGIEADA